MPYFRAALHAHARCTFAVISYKSCCKKNRKAVNLQMQTKAFLFCSENYSKNVIFAVILIDNRCKTSIIN